MSKNLKKFGKDLKDLRIKKELGLRQVCKLTDYDPSNWSKIERGKISPPSDARTLTKWARILGISKKERLQQFVDQARIAQGIIPNDLMTQEQIVKLLPAFFRTLRNKKPTKEEIDKLIELIKDA